MIPHTLKANVADRTVVIRIVDSADGTPETGVAYNTSGIDLKYWKVGANAVVDITEATQTVNGAHSDGGIVHVGAGYYRLDLPDAATSTVGRTIVFGTITDMIVIGAVVDCVAYDPTDTVRLGLTALPNAAADAAGGLPISDAGGLDIDAMNTNVSAILADTGTDGVLLAAAAVDAIHDEVVEGTTTFRQSVRLANAALAGKASGLGTTTAVYRDLADSLDRISATVDADGNRTAVTRTLT